MPEAPHTDLLVPVDQRLGELVQILVLPALRVDLEQRQPPLPAQRVEGGVQARRDLPDPAEPGRVEARAVAEHAAHLLVLPRRHQLEVLEERDDVAQGVIRAPQQP